MTNVPRPPPNAKPSAAQAFLARLAERSPSTAAFVAEQIGAELEAPPARGPAARAPRRASPAATAARAVQGRKRRARARVQAIRERETAYLDRLRARLTALGVEAHRPRMIPFLVWLMCAQVLADRSGRAARLYLARLKNRPAAGSILRASIAPELGAERRSWSDLRTRRIAALGLALVHLAEPTRRRDQWGGGIVKGLARGAFCALLRDPLDPRPTATPSVSTVFGGAHRPGAAPESGQVGYFVPLAAAGLAYRQQLPATEVGRDELGPSGWALNRYWIVTAAFELVAEWARRTVLACVELATGDAQALRIDQRRARAAPT